MFGTPITTRLIGNVLFAASFASFTLTAAAQLPPANRKAPPPPPPPAATDQQQFVSYWTTETGWRTELQLRNNQVGHDRTVTPVLRTADGTETTLSPVVVQPQEVKTLDVAAAIGSSTPQLIGAYGSVAPRYRTPSEANLYAVAMVMGVGHSIAFHIDAPSTSSSMKPPGSPPS
jgi:hypothetical protein